MITSNHYNHDWKHDLCIQTFTSQCRYLRYDQSGDENDNGNSFELDPAVFHLVLLCTVTICIVSIVIMVIMIIMKMIMIMITSEGFSYCSPLYCDYMQQLLHNDNMNEWSILIKVSLVFLVTCIYIKYKGKELNRKRQEKPSPVFITHIMIIWYSSYDVGNSF